MIEILQMFLFLFKSKYRRKTYFRNVLSCCLVFFGALSVVSNVAAKCNNTNCSGNGVCKNDTCLCYDGWQGSQCQFCGGKVRDPYYPKGHKFLARRLKGAKEPPRVLKPGDLSAEDIRKWRPQIGMVPSTQRASLDFSGHRTLAYHTPRRAGQYGNVPPPFSVDRRNNYNDNRSSYGNNNNNNNNNQKSFDSRGSSNQSYGSYSGNSNYRDRQGNFGNQSYDTRGSRGERDDRNQYSCPPGPYRHRYDMGNRYSRR